MTFEEDYPIKGNLRLTYLNEDGVLFQIVPMVNTEMKADMIRAELKVARRKLNEAANKWNENHLDKAKVKGAWLLLKTSLGSDFDVTMSPRARVLLEFEKGLGLEK